MNFQFDKRNFIETYIEKDLIEDQDIKWLNEYADYVSTNITLEYIFMIPDVKDISDYLNNLKPPEIISDVIKKSVFYQAEKNDPGLLLIYIN